MKTPDKIFEQANVFGLGQPNEAYAKYFIGDSYLNYLGAESGVGFTNVTFEPECRNNRHIHRASEGGGQVLICVAGKGIYAEYGKDPVLLTPGKILFVPANVKHFHGAVKNTWFSHVAVELPGKDTSPEWLEEVDEKSYDLLLKKLEK